MTRLAVFAAALLLAAPAFAQTLEPSPSATDPAATSAVPDGADGALAAVRDARANANAIADMKAVTDVHFVRISDVTRGTPSTELTAAMDAGLDDRTGLQAAIKSNAAIAERLQAETIDVSTVVAGRVEQDGSLTLYLE